MKPEVLKAVGIDYDEGVGRFSGRADLYEKFLKKFEEDENFDQCRQAMKAGDVDAAFRHAHALKGITGNLSMNEFYKHLYDVVEALRSKDKALADKLFAELSEEYDKIVAAVKEA